MEDGFVIVVIHGETFPFPVTGGAQLFELLDNNATVFFLPFPGMFQEGVSANLMFGDALFPEHVHHFGFCGNGGMIGTGDPAGFTTLHTAPAHENILHGVVEDMAQSQNASHIGWWDDDGIGFLVLIRF